MKRILPTVLILVVMVLVGVMYWIDLYYYTSPVTGFITRGELWYRYVVLVLPMLMCLLGLRTVGPRAISVLRVRNRFLAGVFFAGAGVSLIYGVANVSFSVSDFSMYGIIFGLLTVWYGVWMFFAAMQLMNQNTPSPTQSALFGMLAALPFAFTTVNRILINPSSIYRVGPLVRVFAGLFAMMWFGMLLRSFYIALPRRRVRWMYFIGVFTFLFATCLEVPQMMYTLLLSNTATTLQVLESVHMAVVGVVAGSISVAIAGQSDGGMAKLKPKDAIY